MTTTFDVSTATNILFVQRNWSIEIVQHVLYSNIDCCFVSPLFGSLHLSYHANFVSAFFFSIFLSFLFSHIFTCGRVFIVTPELQFWWSFLISSLPCVQCFWESPSLNYRKLQFTFMHIKSNLLFCQLRSNKALIDGKRNTFIQL